MVSDLDALARLLRAILRHVFAYGQLLREETVEAVHRARQRILRYLLPRLLRQP